MITVKLVRIISGFVLTEHPHLALMYGGHHPNIDYSYRANLTRRFNGQRQSLRLNFSGKVRPAEIQQTHTSRLSWAGISPGKLVVRWSPWVRHVMSPLTDTDNWYECPAPPSHWSPAIIQASDWLSGPSVPADQWYEWLIIHSCLISQPFPIMPS